MSPLETTRTEGPFSCPKCRAEQEQSDQCIKCGLIFEKYYRLEEERAARTATQPSSPPDAKQSTSTRSIATLIILLLVLCVIICMRFIRTTDVPSENVSGDTLAEKAGVGGGET